MSYNKPNTCSQSKHYYIARPRRNGSIETKHVKGNQPKSLED